MATLQEESMNYEAKQSKNIAELDIVDLSSEVKESQEFKDDEGKPFKYKYIEKDGEKFRMPSSVFEQIKGLLLDRPKMTKVKVKKSGSGLNTKYQVIPID